jgi:hypothetical protein
MAISPEDFGYDGPLPGDENYMPQAFYGTAYFRSLPLHERMGIIASDAEQDWQDKQAIKEDIDAAVERSRETSGHAQGWYNSLALGRQ